MKILANKETCIRKDLDIKLGSYTILAGENNSGKSSLVRAIKDHSDLTDYEKIYIRAEEIDPQQKELKNSAKGDSFYKIIQDILKPIFNKSIINDLIDKFNKNPQKNDFIVGVNNILKNIGVDKKEFDIKISQDKFEESFIIKIAEGIVKDLYKTDIKEVKIENIGMGTQRLIVAALLQYYEREKINKDKKTLFIIEEPEIYLHPKLKESLHNSFLRLVQNENIKVLITTHDPYFIELGKNQKIWNVFRNEKENDTTDIKEVEEKSFILPYNSAAEINYFVFGLPSTSYLLELWQNLKDNKPELTAQDFEKFIISNIENKKEYPHDKEKWKLSYVSRLRHNIAHPKKTIERIVKIELIEKLDDAIEDLLKINAL